jgi:hypothetical protein
VGAIGNGLEKTILKSGDHCAVPASNAAGGK